MTDRSSSMAVLFRTESRVSPADFARPRTESTRVWVPGRRQRAQAGAPEDSVPREPSDPGAAAIAELRAEMETREVGLVARVEQARAEGVEAGKAAMAEEVQAMRASLGVSLERLGAAAEELAAMYREEAVTLAFELARAIVGDALRVDAEALRTVVDRALGSVPRTPEASLRCNPEDVEAIRAFLPEVVARRGDPISIRVVGAEGMERGGCMIDFEEGAVDARPSVALDVLREAVEAALDGGISGAADEGGGR